MYTIRVYMEVLGSIALGNISIGGVVRVFLVFTTQPQMLPYSSKYSNKRYILKTVAKVTIPNVEALNTLI